MQKIETSCAPKAIGPYSQAVRVKVQELLFVSGQLALHPKTGKLREGDVKEQTAQVFDNIEAILDQAGLSLKDVCRMEVFLVNLARDFQAMNEIYSQKFREFIPPARFTVEVAKLPAGALVEIVAIAAYQHI